MAKKTKKSRKKKAAPKKHKSKLSQIEGIIVETRCFYEAISGQQIEKICDNLIEQYKYLFERDYGCGFPITIERIRQLEIPWYKRIF